MSLLLRIYPQSLPICNCVRYYYNIVFGRTAQGRDIIILLLCIACGTNGTSEPQQTPHVKPALGKLPSAGGARALSSNKKIKYDKNEITK